MGCLRDARPVAEWMPVTRWRALQLATVTGSSACEAVVYVLVGRQATYIGYTGNQHWEAGSRCLACPTILSAIRALVTSIRTPRWLIRSVSV